MANTNVSLSEVKATCDKLECSPQSKTSDSAYGGKSKLIHHSGGHAGASVSGNFQAKPKGYSGKYAKKAPKF